MRLVLVPVVIGLAAAVAGGEAVGGDRYSLFPDKGCSALSRTNPCGTRRLPSPVGDPTDGPLTDSLKQGPLDPKPDPLGLDAELPQPKKVKPQTLPSQKD